jgi:ribosomal protein S18 acetylase RimI-like enzyme
VTARVLTLTRELAERLLPQLIALDDLVREELAGGYSEERWGEGEFLAERPDKWRWSRVALDPTGEGERVAGFWIASRNAPHRAHTHRVAVEPAGRSARVGRSLGESVAANARREGVREMTLGVSAGNEGAARFYERLGFRRAAGEDLAGLLGSRSTVAEVGRDYYVTRSGHRAHLYVIDWGEEPTP